MNSDPGRDAGPHADLARKASAHAADLGVELHVEWQEEQRRLTFLVARGNAPPGSGAVAIWHLLGLADAAGTPVVIDVLDSIPALIRYYRRFGFLAFTENGDEAAEDAGLADLVARRERILATAGGEQVDFGVTFMWRDVPTGEKRR